MSNEHLEDEVLNGGVSGTRASINFLLSLRDMLAGNISKKVNVTTKWDGAPAIFAGINPDNGKFFVGTKGTFAKNAKLNYTDEDIDNNHPGEGLNAKLKLALAYLPKLNITGVLQGEMMFTKEDIKNETIDGIRYITFQPNTIVYAVPANSDLAKKISSAQLGIVFHTSYVGSELKSMKASFNIDIKNLKPTKDIWFRDAYFMDASGTVTFTESETAKITQVLSEVGSIFRRTSAKTLNRIASDSEILLQIKTFNNTKVRSGENIKDTTMHVRQLIRWADDRLSKYVLEAKRPETKQKRIAEKNEIMRFYFNNSAELKNIFDMMNLIADAKLMIIKKLLGFKQVTNTFLRTENGFKVTSPEGFVAINHLTGGAVKLVDRMTFSFNNFNVAKNWIGK